MLAGRCRARQTGTPFSGQRAGEQRGVRVVEVTASPQVRKSLNGACPLVCLRFSWTSGATRLLGSGWKARMGREDGGLGFKVEGIGRPDGVARGGRAVIMERWRQRVGWVPDEQGME